MTQRAPTNRVSSTVRENGAGWTSKIPEQRAAALGEHYRAALLDDVIPWWAKHSPDRQQGGFYSCLERDGHAYAGDKFTWMLAREVWMFSHLYNRHRQNPEWLELAQHGAEFLLRHAFLPEGKLHFRFTRDGKPLASCLSLYSEVFTAIGFAELSRAANDPAVWQRAVKMYERILPRLGQPSDTALLGYPLNARFHLHAHDMVRMTIAWVFNELDPQSVWHDDLTRSVKSILERHWKPDLGVMLENVGMDGQPMLDLPEGRMIHPGHAIESAWMLMEIALGPKAAGAPANGNGHQATTAPPNDALMQTAIDIVLQSLERGWDQQYGGLRYVLSIDSSPSHVLEADLKLWWPHCETLYALLLAWAYTGREDIAQWYEKVHDYTFGNFPDAEFGEWYGYLNRDGSPVFTAKATAWKCCFHLPRVLLRCHQLLSRREKSTPGTMQGPHLGTRHELLSPLPRGGGEKEYY